ncbi:GTP-binding protein 4-like protein, partial [Drosera capensis]
GNSCRISSHSISLSSHCAAPPPISPPFSIRLQPCSFPTRRLSTNNPAKCAASSSAKFKVEIRIPLGQRLGGLTDLELFEEMATSSSLIQLWQAPSNKFFFRSSSFVRDCKTMKNMTLFTVLHFCKQTQTATCKAVSGSCMPSPKAEAIPCIEAEKTGAFQQLPMVMPSIDILQSALKKAKKVGPTKGIANIAKRERNRGAKQLDTLMKELAVPLRTYTENFPNRKTLHPYERSLVELTLGDGIYEEVLGKVDTLRKRVVSLGKEHASLCSKSSTKKEAEERLDEGMKKLEDIFNRGRSVVDDLLQIAKTLRGMPVVNLERPTVCLVGAPNVGKSSLVRELSSGKPEVTDTPGLLRRCDEDRNNLEKLTLAVLSNLPTAVLYVHDLTGECGTSPTDQFIIYRDVKERFADHLWVDVVSKCDLLSESPAPFVSELSEVGQIDLARYLMSGPAGAIHVSVKRGHGLDTLKDKVHEVLLGQLSKIKSLKSDEDSP